MNNWQELVPFYVAGLLSPREKAAFETFLRQSAECQQAVAEWQAIANAVREEAASRSSHLPPMAKIAHPTRNGHNLDSLEATVPAYKPPRVEYADVPLTKAKRRPVLPIFAAAAALMMAVCAGILFLVLQSSDSDPDRGSPSKSTPTVERTPTVQATLTTIPNLSQCSISSPVEVDIYAEPDADSTPIGILQPGTYLQSIAKTGNWYGVSLTNNTMGWVRGEDVQLTGACEALLAPTTELPGSTPAPTLNFIPSPTAIPTQAPQDADYELALDRFAATSFNDMVSFPDGDTIDQIELELTGLTEDVDNNYRELQITVTCLLGENMDALRWYWGEDTPLSSSFRCDETGSLVLSNSDNRETLIITLPEGSPRSIVSYTVSINPTLLGGTPVATATPMTPPISPPDTDPHNFPIDPTTTRQMSEQVSVPGSIGDSADNILLTLTNSTFGQRYEFKLLLICSSPNIRWRVGNSETTHVCGEETSEVFLSDADHQKLVSVFMNDYGAASLAEYTLIAQPISSEALATPSGVAFDSEPHDFIVTRSGSNRFSDQLSYPDGDSLDRIHLTFADMLPGEAREVEISLLCAGTGMEYITLKILNSDKSNACTGTLYATFTDQNNQITFDISFLEQVTGTALVGYTLEVRETP